MYIKLNSKTLAYAIFTIRSIENELFDIRRFRTCFSNAYFHSSEATVLRFISFDFPIYSLKKAGVDLLNFELFPINSIFSEKFENIQIFSSKQLTSKKSTKLIDSHKHRHEGCECAERNALDA